MYDHPCYCVNNIIILAWKNKGTKLYEHRIQRYTIAETRIFKDLRENTESMQDITTRKYGTGKDVTSRKDQLSQSTKSPAAKL